MGRYRKIFETALIGIIVVLSLMGMTLMIRLSSLWSQEAAGWAQAIGSVAAIGVAIRIAHNDSNKRVEEIEQKAEQELKIANFTAASIHLTLIHLAETAKYARTKLQYRQTGVFISTFETIAEELNAASHISEDRLIRLIPLQGSCASKITLAQDRIISTVRLLKQTSLDVIPVDADKQSEFARQNSEIISVAITLIEEAIVIVVEQIVQIEPQ